MVGQGLDRGFGYRHGLDRGWTGIGKEKPSGPQDKPSGPQEKPNTPQGEPNIHQGNPNGSQEKPNIP